MGIGLFADFSLCIILMSLTSRRFWSCHASAGDRTIEVVEDYEGSSGQKQLLLKKSNGAALVTEAMVPSGKVDRWWQE